MALALAGLTGAAAGWLAGRARWKSRHDHSALDWQGRLNVRDREVAGLRTRERAAVAEARDLRERVASAEEHAAGLERTAEIARAELEAARRTVANFSEQMASLERDLGESHAELARLDLQVRQETDRASAAESTREDAETAARAAERAVRAAEEQVRRLEVREREARRGVAPLEKEIERLRERLQAQEAESRAAIHDREERIGLLCQRVKELEAMLPELEGLRERSRLMETLERELGERDRALQAMTNGLEDDLTRIRGVGRVLQKKLRKGGFRRYRDLAVLDAQELDAKLGALNLRPVERIRREDWIGQARKLHRAKYGESLPR